MVEEAFHIDEIVENAVKTHSINPGNIEGEIRKQLLSHYFKVLGGLDAVKSLNRPHLPDLARILHQPRLFRGTPM